ncbi:MAG: hypothetical protein ACOC8Y_00820 [Candidatus Natronoplasma sp.]
MIAYLLILVLLIYSGIMTYLYWKEKKKNRRGGELLNGDVDIKVQKIGDRLEEIKKNRNEQE